LTNGAQQAARGGSGPGSFISQFGGESNGNLRGAKAKIDGRAV
jgi:hypothetical protein